MHLKLTVTITIYLGWVFSQKQIQGKTVCVGNYELQTYDEKVNYDEAKRRCGHTSRHLAKLVSSSMTDALNKIIGRGDIYFIGLRYSLKRWRWQDNSGVSYSNWVTGHPVLSNGDWLFPTSYHCAEARGSSLGKWRTVECNAKRSFICQRTLQAPGISVEPKSVTVSTSDKYTITCSAQKVSSCAPAVTWQDESSTISFGANSEVHQTRSSTQSHVTSTLVLKNPKISATGSYICRVSLGSHIRSVRANVYVESYPTIQEVTTANCSSNVTITWEPSSRALGFFHLFKVYAADDSTELREIRNRVSLSDTTITKTVTFLKPSSSYFIEISACRTSACTYGYSARSTVTTQGIPHQVRSATMSSDGENCTVAWNPPNKIVDAITGYIITIGKELKESRGSTLNVTEIQNLINTSHVFDIEPNIQYQVEIKAVTCARPGDEVVAIGTCIGNPAVPKNVEKPEIEKSDSGTNIKVFVPVETRGLISCIFVMLSLGGEEKSFLEEYTVEKTFDDLTTSTILDRNIVVAVPYSRVATNGSFNVALGDGSLSHCNLFETGKVNTTSSKSLIFTGRNKPVTDDSQFRAYVVIAVPHKENVFLRRSEDAFLFKPDQYTTENVSPSTNTNETMSSESLQVIDLKYLGFLALMMPLMIIVWKLSNLRQDSSKKKEPGTQNPGDTETPNQEDPETLNQEEVHTYEEDLGPNRGEEPLSPPKEQVNPYEECDVSCSSKNDWAVENSTEPVEQHLYTKVLPRFETNLDGSDSSSEGSPEIAPKEIPGPISEYVEMHAIYSHAVNVASPYAN